jgi:predicted MFS family arabinose efflux permease
MPATAVLTLAIGAVFATSALETMLTPALPAIQHDLGVSPGQLAWVVTAPLLAGCVTAPVIARIADLGDRWTVFRGVLATVGLGVVISALAPSILWVAIGQALQGLFFSLLPLAVSLGRELLPPDKRANANGALTIAGTASTAAGLLLAAPLNAAMGWRSLYWVALAALGLILVAALVRRPARRTDIKPVKIGLIAPLLLGLWIATLLVAVTLAPEVGWTSPQTLGLFGFAVLVAALWARTELRAAEPLVDLRLLSTPPLASLSMVAFAMGFGTFASFVTAPLLSRANGASVDSSVGESGLFLLPLGLAGMITAPLVAGLRRRIGSRGVMMLGTSIVFAGLLLLAFIHGARYGVPLSMGIVGAGIGFALTEAMNAAVEHSPSDRAAGASALFFVVKSMGGALGAQICASVLVSGRADAFTIAFALSAGVAALAIPACLGLPPRVRTLAAA